MNKNETMERTARETAPNLYETENDLPKDARVEVIGILNQRLADIIDLQTQLKQAHWNVKGPHFIGLHELFDKIAEEVENYVDMIAERAVQLGGIAEGTVRIAASRSRLDEYGPSLTSSHTLSQWCRWRGSNPHTLSSTRF